MRQHRPQERMQSGEGQARLGLDARNLQQTHAAFASDGPPPRRAARTSRSPPCHGRRARRRFQAGRECTRARPHVRRASLLASSPTLAIESSRRTTMRADTASTPTSSPSVASCSRGRLVIWTSALDESDQRPTRYAEPAHCSFPRMRASPRVRGSRLLRTTSSRAVSPSCPSVVHRHSMGAPTAAAPHSHSGHRFRNRLPGALVPAEALTAPIHATERRR